MNTNAELPVFSFDKGPCAYVPLSRIKVVRPSGDGLIDVIYTERRRLPSGISAQEVRTGYSTIDQLLIALGLQAGMPHNEALAKLDR